MGSNPTATASSMFLTLGITPGQRTAGWLRIKHRQLADTFAHTRDRRSVIQGYRDGVQVVVEQVRIDVQRHRGRGMAEHLLNRFEYGRNTQPMARIETWSTLLPSAATAADRCSSTSSLTRRPSWRSVPTIPTTSSALPRSTFSTWSDKRTGRAEAIPCTAGRELSSHCSARSFHRPGAISTTTLQ